jgi:copper chaperone CopZ
MKNISKILMIAIIAVTFVGGTLFAEDAKEAKIQTNAHCGSCKTKIENGLGKVDGVIKSEVNMDTKIATVSYYPSKTSETTLVKTVADLGYTATAAKSADCAKSCEGMSKEECASKCKSAKTSGKDACCPSKSTGTKTTESNLKEETK